MQNYKNKRLDSCIYIYIKIDSSVFPVQNDLSFISFRSKWHCLMTSSLLACTMVGGNLFFTIEWINILCADLTAMMIVRTEQSDS